MAACSPTVGGATRHTCERRGQSTANSTPRLGVGPVAARTPINSWPGACSFGARVLSAARPKPKPTIPTTATRAPSSGYADHAICGCTVRPIWTRPSTCSGGSCRRHHRHRATRPRARAAHRPRDSRRGSGSRRRARRTHQAAPDAGRQERALSHGCRGRSRAGLAWRWTRGHPINFTTPAQRALRGSHAIDNSTRFISGEA